MIPGIRTVTLVGVSAGVLALIPRARPADEIEGVQAIRFVDCARAAGISFVHDNAATAEKYLIETMGAGAGWLDYDQDGFLDLYLANSAATKAYKPAHPLRAALYHNNGDGTFSDVTERAGVQAEGVFGMGVAVGDYDNDGFPDLYVIGYGRSILYHNNHDGTFADVTEKARVANPAKWGSSGAWFDYDRDGWLDLAVVNYVDWSPQNNIACGDAQHRAYCHPNKYRGQTPMLFHNNRDGTFTDVSGPSRMGTKPGNGLGIVCFDYNGDGWQDLFIANDSMPNFLYVNRRNGTFDEVGLEAGVAFGENGQAEAGMGVDAADYNADGRLDLFVTHLDLEFNRLFKNNGDGTFEDATFAAKLGYRTFHMSGFGTRFFDYDNDGWRDIFIANGHVLDNIGVFHTDSAYAEEKIVFHNVHGTFVTTEKTLGPDLAIPKVSRAAAFADFDNDGDVDVLVTNSGQEAQLFRNDGGNQKHWLELRLIGSRSNRDGIGARVKVVSGGATQVDEAKGGMSYQSAHDPRLHFGLGDQARVEQVEVRWPSGTVDKLTSLAADRLVTIKEGAGEVESLFPQLRKRAVDGVH
jgi:enediyne biosynthesis protein E4